MKKIFIVTSFLLLILETKAQISFENYKNIDVYLENNRKIQNPFAGGLDAPQFSTMDLNFDGIKDLVIFDREGTKISTYINEGVPNQISYIHAPEYEKFFPVTNYRIALVDYNGDGKEDIFADAPGGVRILKNTSSAANGISFVEVSSLVYNDYGPITIPLFVEQTDIPAILDVDGDGDIDILTFYKSIDTSGESMYWYKNLSVENFGRTDTFLFETGKECWGRFRESFVNCRPNLQYGAGVCATGGRGIRDLSAQEVVALFEPNADNPAHAGSTLLVFDANNDNKYDLLVGDVSCTSMYILYNSTDNINPIFTSYEKFYPTVDPIDVELFPASFLLDVNNDSKKDLIVAPNTTNNSGNYENIHLYLRNDSTTGKNIFNYTSNNFLESEMIDLGEGAQPCFVDYNNDGLMDLVIGNTGYYVSSGTYKTGLALFENIGTLDSPAFKLITRDWLGFSNLNISNMSIDFADLDNDGDLDMVSGAIDGLLHFFRNLAGPNQTINLEYVPNYFNTIDVGNNSTPFIYDIDEDGKYEIIVGERSNNINLIANTGTISNPMYTLATDSLWKINMGRIMAYPAGRTSVKIARLSPSSTEKTLLISNANGTIYASNTIPNSINDSLTLFHVNNPFLYIANSYFGSSNAAFNIDVADINNDGKPEIVSGLPQGGVYLFKNTSVFQSVNSKLYQFDLTLLPNPVENTFHLSSTEKISKLIILDMKGQKIYEEKLNSTNATIDVSNYPSGIYTVQATNNNGTSVKKFIKQ